MMHGDGESRMGVTLATARLYWCDSCGDRDEA
ncbi:hypothetical protein ES703_44983 [subsurface metagenome]